MVQSNEDSTEPRSIKTEQNHQGKGYNIDVIGLLNKNDDPKSDATRKKRNRQIISCTSCRRKKIKCDRTKPICSSCCARGYPLEDCIYNETVRKIPKPNSKQRKQQKVSKSQTADSQNSSSQTNISMSELKSFSPLHSIIDHKIKSQISCNSYLKNEEFQKLNNELNDINHRRQLIDHTAKNMEPCGHSISNEYLNMKMDLLSRENEILKQINSNLYDYSIKTFDQIQKFKVIDKESKKIPDFDNNITYDELQSSLFNDRIAEMEYQPLDKCILFKPINVSIIHFMRFKPNRTIHFGPTCFRSAIAYNSNFAQIYHFISKLTTKDRKKFKNSRKFLNDCSFFPFNIESFQNDALNTRNDSLPLTNSGNSYADNKFIVHLLNILPKHQQLVELISIFFDKYLHHLIPIVERNYMMNIFNEVFVPKTPEEKTDITDKNKNDFKCNIIFQYRDFSRISLILAIIRLLLLFTEQSFDSIDPAIRNSERPKIENILGYYSMKLLSSLNFLKKPLVTTLQALLMLKIHSTYDLDDGEGGDTSDGYLMNSIAYNMAIMCGLHRNVDENYKDFPTDFREMLKNIWKYCLFIDWQHSFQLGYPLSMDDILFSENSTRKVFQSYTELIDECEISRQINVVIQYANRDVSSNNLLYEYILPVLRNLSYQLNNLKFRNLSIFRLEIYIQSLVQLCSNTRIFSPLYESFTNPLAQANQLPKNEFKFTNFLKRIEVQLILIDVIFTLYNLVLMILQKLGNDSMDDPNIPKFINFYANQTVNFAIFTMRVAKKFLSLKAKDKVFQTYLFSGVKQLIYRISLFFYSDLLFSFGGPNATNHKTIRDFSNNSRCYFSKNKQMIKNIRGTDHDTLINICPISSLTDNSFNNICFLDNQYDLLASENCLEEQYCSLMDFVTNKYTYYNFYVGKLDISNLIFEFYFKTVKDNLRHYYVFYVLYNISMHFYTYLKERNLVRSINYEEETRNSDSNGIDDSVEKPNQTLVEQPKLSPMIKVTAPIDATLKQEFLRSNNNYNYFSLSSPGAVNSELLNNQMDQYKQRDFNNIEPVQTLSTNNAFALLPGSDKGNISLQKMYQQTLAGGFENLRENRLITSNSNNPVEYLTKPDDQMSNLVSEITNQDPPLIVSTSTKILTSQAEESFSSTDYSPLDLLGNEFYIDINELFEKINSQQ